MQFDDRLATVLRQSAGAGAVARTQFRQLVDLLSRPHAAAEPSLMDAAWSRLDEVAQSIPAEERAAILREPGTRLAHPRIVCHLAGHEPAVASAALEAAALDSSGWEALIPRLPVRARGFLRLRRGLPERAMVLLDRLGIHDRALPQPPLAEPAAASAEPDLREPAAGSGIKPIAANDADPPLRDASEIGALRQRIETFRQSRAARNVAGDNERADTPQLPLGENNEGRETAALPGFAFTTDAQLAIDWAEDRAAPMIQYATLDRLLPMAARDLARRRRALDTIELELPGAAALAGEWILDARPRFSPDDGSFEGYAGRFRRPIQGVSPVTESDSGSDRLRQLLHELRTPVNAIQGFAEILQQQMFGTVPHEYRAHAASIAGDGARILAGFDELDRLAKLEGGEQALESGEADLSSIVEGQGRQLDTILARRDAGLDITIAPDISVAIGREEAEAMVWRILATLAGSLAPGQRARVSLQRKKHMARLKCSLPGRKNAAEMIFEAKAKTAGGPVSAGIFGAGFTLRLARAEAEAASGALRAAGSKLVLELPLSTRSQGEPRVDPMQKGVAGS